MSISSNAIQFPVHKQPHDPVGPGKSNVIPGVGDERGRRPCLVGKIAFGDQNLRVVNHNHRRAAVPTGSILAEDSLIFTHPGSQHPKLDREISRSKIPILAVRNYQIIPHAVEVTTGSAKLGSHCGNLRVPVVNRGMAADTNIGG